MSGKGRRAYNKAPTKEKLREWGSLSIEGDKSKFVDVRKLEDLLENYYQYISLKTAIFTLNALNEENM